MTTSTLTTGEIEERLAEIVEGIAGDIFKAERYYSIFNEISAHAKR